MPTRTPVSQARAAFERFNGAWDADAGVAAAVARAKDDATKGVALLAALAGFDGLPADQNPSDALASGRKAVTFLTKLEKGEGSFADAVNDARFHLATASSKLGQQFRL